MIADPKNLKSSLYTHNFKTSILSPMVALVLFSCKCAHLPCWLWEESGYHFLNYKINIFSETSSFTVNRPLSYDNCTIPLQISSFTLSLPLPGPILLPFQLSQSFVTANYFNKISGQMNGISLYGQHLFFLGFYRNIITASFLKFIVL